MKKEIHPAVVIIAIVLLVAGITVIGFRSMQPQAYAPSPGLGGPGSKEPVPGQVATPAQPTTTAPSDSGQTYYPGPAPGSIPGKPQ